MIRILSTNFHELHLNVVFSTSAVFIAGILGSIHSNETKIRDHGRIVS
jgi:hypothetical protein